MRHVLCTAEIDYVAYSGYRACADMRFAHIPWHTAHSYIHLGRDVARIVEIIVVIVYIDVSKVRKIAIIVLQFMESVSHMTPLL